MKSARETASSTSSVTVTDPPERAALRRTDRDPLRRGLVRGRRGVDEVHAELGCDRHQRTADVRAIAHEDDGALVQASALWEVLAHRQQVAHDLGGVVVVRQPVDHRDI